jgi:NADH-quinone oxidoreductase subunit H
MSSLTVILFLGGWLPIFGFGWITFIPGWFWFSLKLVFVGFIFIWIQRDFT